MQNELKIILLQNKQYFVIIFKVDLALNKN